MQRPPRDVRRAAPGYQDRRYSGCPIGLAAATLSEGESAEAEGLLMESIALRRDFGSRSGIVSRLAGLAGVQASRRHFLKAARLLGAAEAYGRGQPSPYAVDAK